MSLALLIPKPDEAIIRKLHSKMFHVLYIKVLNKT